MGINMDYSVKIKKTFWIPQSMITIIYHILKKANFKSKFKSESISDFVRGCIFQRLIKDEETKEMLFDIIHIERTKRIKLDNKRKSIQKINSRERYHLKKNLVKAPNLKVP